MTHVATRLTKRQSTSGFDTVAEHYRNIREDAPVGSSLLSRLINSLSSSPFLVRYPRPSVILSVSRYFEIVPALSWNLRAL